MSLEDAEKFIDSVREMSDKYEQGAVVIFVDFHEDLRRRNTKQKAGPTDMSVFEAMNSVHVARTVGKPILCTLKAADIIVARVVERVVAETDAAKAVDEAHRRAVAENISIEGLDPYELLAQPNESDYDCVIAYERKTLQDFISSTKSRGSSGREQHLDEQLGRMLVFCQATGAQPRFVLEGFAQNELTGCATGVQVSDHAHSGLARIALIDNVSPWHSDSTLGTARLVLKDAREVHEQRLSAKGWRRMGTGDDRAATVKMAIAKADNYDVERWFRGALESIPLMSETRARVIMEHYPTMLSLVRALEREQDDKERLKLVADLKCGERRLGDALGRRVLERFYEKDDGESTTKRKEPAQRKPIVLPAKKRRPLVLPKKKSVSSSSSSSSSSSAESISSPSDSEEISAPQRPPPRRAALAFNQALKDKKPLRGADDVDDDSSEGSDFDEVSDDDSDE